jgi:tRNA 2-thiocytidine biosynthesis protein TtcA
MQRKVIKAMMLEWEEKYPNRKEIMMTALGKVHPSHLFDSEIYDFDSLTDKINIEKAG